MERAQELDGVATKQVINISTSPFVLNHLINTVGVKVLRLGVPSWQPGVRGFRIRRGETRGLGCYIVDYQTGGYSTEQGCTTIGKGMTKRSGVQETGLPVADTGLTNLRQYWSKGVNDYQSFGIINSLVCMDMTG
ncbi:hypothetical protein EDD15DRAFT_2200427 [Pisolithus albus]|nr:hypothetical protein EDD15DRAFT_2200427 [Pisolithus albus]